MFGPTYMAFTTVGSVGAYVGECDREQLVQHRKSCGRSTSHRLSISSSPVAWDSAT